MSHFGLSLRVVDKQQKDIFGIKLYRFWRKENMLSSRPARLLKAKTVYLNDDKNVQSSFTIGINPTKISEARAIIENRKKGDILKLDIWETQDFCEFFEKYEDCEDTFLQKIDSDGEMNFRLFSVRKSGPHTYHFNFNGRTIDIDDATMIALYRVKTQISWCVTSYMIWEIDEFQNQFFKFMQYFCKGWITQKYPQFIERISPAFFDYMTFENIDGINDSFIAEISTNFRDWFLKCVPLYMETLLLKESVRLSTFSFGWPHKEDFICIKELCQAGLYYTAKSDQVACVYCDILLHEWEAGDIPMVEHYKFSPRCLFLVNWKRTRNNPDIYGVEPLEKILSTLPERGYDEVD